MTNDTAVTDGLTIQLDREIRNHLAGLDNCIVLRREHPSYGYTKAEILARLNRLVGMLYARWVMLNGPSAAVELCADEAATDMGIDLADVTTRARAA